MASLRDGGIMNDEVEKLHESLRRYCNLLQATDDARTVAVLGELIAEIEARLREREAHPPAAAA